MNALRKVVVVDDGHRTAFDLLSTELAELGVSSVTTPVDAAREVLDVIERPSAVFLDMPQRLPANEREQFRLLADQLRGSAGLTGVPVIEYDRELVDSLGGISAVLRSAIGPQALSGRES